MFGLLERLYMVSRQQVGWQVGWQVGRQVGRQEVGRQEVGRQVPCVGRWPCLAHPCCEQLGLEQIQLRYTSLFLYNLYKQDQLRINHLSDFLSHSFVGLDFHTYRVSVQIFHGPFPASFFFIFVCSTANSKHVLQLYLTFCR